LREGEGVLSNTTCEAYVLGGHSAVVMVEGYRASISLSHIQPVEPIAA